MTVTAHTININFKLQTFVLSTTKLQNSHTVEYLATCLKKKWLMNGKYLITL